MSDLPDMREDLALLRDAAAEAGRIAMSYFRRNPKVSWKEGMSPVTEADLHADAYLRQTLLAARPDYGINAKALRNVACRCWTLFHASLNADIRKPASIRKVSCSTYTPEPSSRKA